MANGPAFRFRQQTVLLSLALIIFASSAAVVHIHPQLGENGPDGIHCLICVAAHSPTVLTSAIAPPPVCSGIRALDCAPEINPHSRLLSPDLFIRPPPVSL
jgi:hypothetical protein